MGDESKKKTGNALTLATLEERINVLGQAVMGSDNYRKLMHGAVSTRSSVKRAFSDQMARNLHFYNMPSQDDLISLGEQCNRIEERLVQMESNLNRLVEHLSGKPEVKMSATPRTRKRAPASKSRTASKKTT